LAFILLAGQPESFCLVDLGSAKTIDALLARYRSQITGDCNDVSFNQSDDRHLLLPRTGRDLKLSASENVGIALRNKIFDPLVSAIGNNRKLFISPDGNLTQIPFEILPTDDGKRLIDIYSISYLSTGRDVIRFNFKSDRKATQCIMIANPDFDYSHNSTSLPLSESEEFHTKQSRDLNLSEFIFDPLPGTSQEGEIIAELLSMRKWFGKQASKKNIFEAIRSPLILHIATHGFFLPNQKIDVAQEHLLDITSQLFNFHTENPLLRSCLALAGANWKHKNLTPHSDAGNGILTAEEVSTLDLSATELVVLSACETGRGETLAGEGVFGLRRAFVLAGAKTLIISLWKVPDRQTKELMVDFYNRLLGGESRSEALRNAQLGIRKKYPNPYFWGAFICQGYSGSLTVRSFSEEVVT
jgi:CHAT domain-containing protein